MKNLIVIVLTLLGIATYAQNEVDYFQPSPKYPLLFKAVPQLSNKEPQWVTYMYGSEVNVYTLEKMYVAYYTNKVFEKNIHTQNYKHLLKNVYANNWLDSTGNIVVKSKEQASKSIKSNKRITTNAWQSIGPYDTYGDDGVEKRSEQVNVYAIAQSQSNPKVLICGTETSGVYKSIDKGEHWFALGADYFTENVVGLEIDPTNENIMYLSSSNRIFKSIDGGMNWSVIYQLNDISIYEFAISPNNSNQIFAAGNGGLFRSNDGGNNWIRIYEEECWDVKFKKDNSGTLYVLKSNPAAKRIEFLVSTDGGGTFLLKDNGWFQSTATSSIGGARMGLSKADTNRVYVVMLGNVDNYNVDNNYIGIYRSDNGADNWFMPYDQNLDGIPNNNPGGPYSDNHWCLSNFGVSSGGYNQGFYNLGIAVSDTNADKFMVGMLNLFKSENGGENYTLWGGYGCNNCTPYYRHPDIQDIHINGNDVFVCSDGGIDLYDGNLNIIKAINNGINEADNWGFGQGWNEDVVTSGRYHNGNAYYHANYGNGKFKSLGGGEAPTGYVALGDNFKVYHSDTGAHKISSNFTDAPEGIATLSMMPAESYYVDSKSEIEYDPRYFNHLYLGNENKLWKSLDGGNSFSLFKAFGTDASKGVKGFEISRLDPNIMFVVQHDNGAKLWRTMDGGQTWSNLVIPSTETRLYISLNEKNVLFLGYGSGSDNLVFKSNDLGNSWVNLTTPAIQNQGVVVISAQLGTNDGVYIGLSGNKIYYRNNGHNDWQLYNENLPLTTQFMGMKPFYKNSELRISSNKGFWKAPLFEKSMPVAQPMVASQQVLCHRLEVQFDDYSVLDHTNATWTWSFPGASAVSSLHVRNPKVTYSTPGEYDVTLTVVNSNGTSTKTIQKMIKVTGTSLCSPKPVVDKAISFSKTETQYVTQSLNPSKAVSNFTFTAWIKPNGIQQDYASILYTNGITLDFKNGKNELGTHCGGNWYFNSGLIVPKDQWSYVGLIYTPTKVTLILNEQIFEMNGNFATQNLSAIDLGIHNRRSDRKYVGLLDEVCIWDRALTLDEIRLGRHVTKVNDIDANWLGYYQFNDISNGTVYDVKKGNDLTVVNSPMLVPSLCPAGPGVSMKLNVNANQTLYDFDKTKVKIKTNDSNSNGELYVTRLITPPFEFGFPDTILNQEYYIIDNYGANQAVGNLNFLSFYDVGNLNKIADKKQIKLYQRERNAENQEGWVLKASPDGIGASNVDFLAFNPLSNIPFNNEVTNNTIDQFSGHFLLTTTTNLNGADSVKKPLVVYPNPVSKDSGFRILNLNQKARLTIFDNRGREVYKADISGKETIKIDVQASVYIYRIATEEEMFVGKLLVE